MSKLTEEDLAEQLEELGREAIVNMVDDMSFLHVRDLYIHLLGEDNWNELVQYLREGDY